jgi:hypothetical protein
VKRFKAFGMSCAVFISLAGCRSPSDRVIAQVDDQKIKVSDLENFARAWNTSLHGNAIPPGKFLKPLIDQVIVLSLAHNSPVFNPQESDKVNFNAYLGWLGSHDLAVSDSEAFQYFQAHRKDFTHLTGQRQPMEHGVEFKQVKQRVINSMTESKLDAWLAKQRAKAHVSIDQEALAAISN